jgi:hypothetical protein
VSYDIVGGRRLDQLRRRVRGRHLTFVLKNLTLGSVAFEDLRLPGADYNYDDESFVFTNGAKA